jgi:hypothetical protein
VINYIAKASPFGDILHCSTRKVVLPDGKVIEYLVDGRNRRVGKKVNGVIERQWIYDGQLRPVEEWRI